MVSGRTRVESADSDITTEIEISLHQMRIIWNHISLLEGGAGEYSRVIRSS